ncbi:MAG: GntR family transcriptional regulator [Chloroflexota bacterium]
METNNDSAIRPAPFRALTLEPIEQVDLPARVYRLLRQKMFAGEFAPGAKLDLDQLEKGLRISRTPLNSALMRLAEEGLVRIEPRRGTFIRELTAQDVVDAWDVRGALEVLAAERGMPNVTDEGLDHIERLLDQLAETRHFIDEAYVEAAALDRRFHQNLVEFAHNRKLLDVYGGLYTDIVNARLFYHGRAREWAITDAEHRAILGAYRRREVAAAREAITTAVENGRQALLRRIVDLGGVI